MKKITLVVLTCASFGLASCETTGPKQQSGAVIGALAGGLVGSQFGSGSGRVGAALAGAALGGIIGGSIGAQLDAQDRARLQEITTASIRTGGNRSFRNPKTGVRATTRVVSSNNANGKLCRTVQQDVTLANGQVSRDTVSGCKGPNGWTV